MSSFISILCRFLHKCPADPPCNLPLLPKCRGCGNARGPCTLHLFCTVRKLPSHYPWIWDTHFSVALIQPAWYVALVFEPHCPLGAQRLSSWLRSDLPQTHDNMSRVRLHSFHPDLNVSFFYFFISSLTIKYSLVFFPVKNTMKREGRLRQDWNKTE